MPVELIHFILPHLPPPRGSSHLTMSAVIDALFKTMKFYVQFKGSSSQPLVMLGNVLGWKVWRSGETVSVVHHRCARLVITLSLLSSALKQLADVSQHITSHSQHGYGRFWRYFMVLLHFLSVTDVVIGHTFSSLTVLLMVFICSSSLVHPRWFFKLSQMSVRSHFKMSVFLLCWFGPPAPPPPNPLPSVDTWTALRRGFSCWCWACH